MNKKGLTILELLISITVVSMIVLLLIKVMFSLDNIINSKDYASNDMISRTEIIKKVQNDFWDLKLKGINIEKNQEKVVVSLKFAETEKNLEIYDNYLMYDGLVYNLESRGASYSRQVEYKYTNIDDEYYLVSLNIPVIMDGDDTIKDDDISLIHMGLKMDDNSFIDSYE